MKANSECCSSLSALSSRLFRAYARLSHFGARPASQPAVPRCTAQQPQSRVVRGGTAGNTGLTDGQSREVYRCVPLFPLPPRCCPAEVRDPAARLFFARSCRRRTAPLPLAPLPLKRAAAACDAGLRIRQRARGARTEEGSPGMSRWLLQLYQWRLCPFVRACGVCVSRPLASPHPRLLIWLTSDD
jgi:hypothetical protein